MDTFYSVVGAVVIIILLLIVLAGVILFFWERYVTWNERRLRQAVELEIRRRGDRMRAQWYWFSTTPELAAMWAACAEELSQGGWPSAEYVRDSRMPRLREELPKEFKR